MNTIKACVLGESGVGKTTLTKLLQHQTLDPTAPRCPTIGVNIEKVETNEGNVCMWDLGGQRRFQIMWDEFLRGSKLTIVVTDSTPANVMLTKDLVERFLNKSASDVIAIANKQDLAGRMSPSEIEAALGLPTYGMVSINEKNEAKLREILEKHLTQ